MLEFEKSERVDIDDLMPIPTDAEQADYKIMVFKKDADVRENGYVSAASFFKGPPGAQGVQGETGPRGPQGLDAPSVLSQYKEVDFTLVNGISKIGDKWTSAAGGWSGGGVSTTAIPSGRDFILVQEYSGAASHNALIAVKDSATVPGGPGTPINAGLWANNVSEAVIAFASSYGALGIVPTWQVGDLYGIMRLNGLLKAFKIRKVDGVWVGLRDGQYEFGVNDSALYPCCNIYAGAELHNPKLRLLNEQDADWDLKFVGDSLAAAPTIGAVDDISEIDTQAVTISYPILLREQLHTPKRFTMQNYAVSGMSIWGGMLDASQIQLVENSCNAVKKRLICIYACMNDIQGGADGTEGFARLQNLCTVYKNKGFKVIVFTITSTRAVAWTDSQTAIMWGHIEEVNARLRDEYKNFADMLVDLQTDLNLAGYDAPLNPTYFYDKIHYSKYGSSKVATLAAKAIHAVVENLPKRIVTAF